MVDFKGTSDGTKAHPRLVQRNRLPANVVGIPGTFLLWGVRTAANFALIPLAARPVMPVFDLMPDRSTIRASHQSINVSLFSLHWLLTIDHDNPGYQPLL